MRVNEQTSLAEVCEGDCSTFHCAAALPVSADEDDRAMRGSSRLAHFTQGAVALLASPPLSSFLEVGFHQQMRGRAAFRKIRQDARVDR